MNSRVASHLILCGSCVIAAALAACATLRQERFTVDLQHCSLEGHGLDEVLRWTPDSIDFDSPRYHLFEQLSLRGPQAGVYLGHCTIDNVTGQALVIDLREATGLLQLLPPLDQAAGHAAVEQYFGAPHTSYRTLGSADKPTGSRGEWRNLCPGYTIKIRFDADQHPRSLTVQPY